MPNVKNKYSNDMNIIDKIIKKYDVQAMHNDNFKQELLDLFSVSNRFSFAEKEPELGTYVALVWEDGSDCNCLYEGLDKTIKPLPIEWYYVTLNGC
jgi:hypothetical protein